MVTCSANIYFACYWCHKHILRPMTESHQFSLHMLAKIVTWKRRCKEVKSTKKGWVWKWRPLVNTDVGILRSYLPKPVCMCMCVCWIKIFFIHMSKTSYPSMDAFISNLLDLKVYSVKKEAKKRSKFRILRKCFETIVDFCHDYLIKYWLHWGVLTFLKWCLMWYSSEV